MGNNVSHEGENKITLMGFLDTGVEDNEIADQHAREGADLGFNGLESFNGKPASFIK